MSNRIVKIVKCNNSDCWCVVGSNHPKSDPIRLAVLNQYFLAHTVDYLIGSACMEVQVHKERIIFHKKHIQYIKPFKLH